MEEGPSRYKVLISALLAMAFLVGLGLFIIRMPAQEKPLEIAIPTPTVSSPRELKVYVSGAVKQAGVYTLREGNRVEDALRAAGGASPEADLSRINLAARVRDEMHIYIPLPGESPPPSSLGSEAQAKVDINTASATLLESLPEVGPVTAQKIIAHRQKNGPFRRIEDLRDAKLVGPATFEKIKDLITVR